MNTEIIGAEKDYGFTLTRFAGPKKIGRCYQIDGGIRGSTDDPFEPRSIALSDWQMLQLVAAYVKDHNTEALRSFLFRV